MIKTNGSSGRLPAAANSFMIITLAVVSDTKLDNNGLNRLRHSKLPNGPCTMTSLASENIKIVAKIHFKNISRSIKIRNSNLSTERQRTKMEVGKRTHFISKAEAVKTPEIGSGKPRKISLNRKLDRKQAEKVNMISSKETYTICFIDNKERISNVKTSTIGIIVISSNKTKVNTAKEKVIKTHLKHGTRSRTFMIRCTQLTLLESGFVFSAGSASGSLCSKCSNRCENAVMLKEMRC